MKLGMIGLGRMGANMSVRLLRAGHEVVAYNRHPEKTAPLVRQGAVGTTSLEEMRVKLERPRVLWLMVPAEAVEGVIDVLRPLLEADDVIVDGGNSYYRDDIRRAKALAPDGIRHVDVGTSGGLWGLERGYCQMIGGEREVVERLAPVFAALAPPVDSAPRTPGRVGEPSPEVWRGGSVIASWLLDLTAAALQRSPGLDEFAGRVSDSGEGRWTLKAAVDESVPAPILASAIAERVASRGEADFANRLLSAMRFEFGGHQEKRP